MPRYSVASVGKKPSYHRTKKGADTEYTNVITTVTMKLLSRTLRQVNV